MSTARWNAILLVILLLSQLLLMSGSVQGGDGSQRLRSWLTRVSGPVVDASGNAGGAFRDAVGGSQQLFGTRARNRELESEVQRLSTELRRAREAVEENARLRRLLDMREELVPDSLGASVVTASHAGEANLIVIDRGVHDGVRVDQPVVAWGGAVGRVVSVDAGHAVVRLLDDPFSGVAAVVQRSRAQGVVVGRGGKTLDMLYVPRFSDVLHGDRVVTSGMDGIFPRGFGIGRVSAVHEVPDGSQRIQVEPEVDLRSLEEVLVLLSPPRTGLLEPPVAHDPA
jgi:rod shape-determining protein MreC